MSKPKKKKVQPQPVHPNNTSIWLELAERLRMLRFKVEILQRVAQNGTYREITVKAHTVKRHRRMSYTRIIFTPAE
jgi:hypothetical protein